jgi:hypothetical protein
MLLREYLDADGDIGPIRQEDAPALALRQGGMSL